MKTCIDRKEAQVTAAEHSSNRVYIPIKIPQHTKHQIFINVILKITAFILISFVISFAISSIEGRVNEEEMMSSQDASSAVNEMVNRTNKFINETVNKKDEIIAELNKEIEIAIQMSNEQIRTDNSSFQELLNSSKPECVSFNKSANFLDLIDILDEELISCKANVSGYLFDSINNSISRIQANITNYKNSIKECKIDSPNSFFGTCFMRISFNYQAKINEDEIKVIGLMDRANAEKSSIALTFKKCADLAVDRAHQQMKKILDDIEKCVDMYTVYWRLGT